MTKEESKKISARPRVTLRNKDIESGVGAELLSVCQSILDDGRISEQEVRELERWLSDHSILAELPAISFLSTLVSQIIKDSVIAHKEREELQRGIERILPIEIRQLVKLKKIEARQEDQENKKKEEELERQNKQESRDRNRRLETFNFMVAGARRDEYQRVIERSVREGNKVILARDPENPVDKNAVKLWTQIGEHFGYVPRHDAKQVAKLLDQGCKYEAYVTKEIGYKFSIPVVQINIFQNDSNREGLMTSEDSKNIEGNSIQLQQSTNSGCFILILLLLGFFFSMFLL